VHVPVPFHVPAIAKRHAITGPGCPPPRDPASPQVSAGTGWACAGKFPAGLFPENFHRIFLKNFEQILAEKNSSDPEIKFSPDPILKKKSPHPLKNHSPTPLHKHFTTSPVWARNGLRFQIMAKQSLK